ncbi:MAG: hypothetical protein DME88_10750 [Verrucomicrobia bacterium]|nr:MAG: hypothetical protein DME88_10750 [Verrucomicrobiota bacterium]
MTFQPRIGTNKHEFKYSGERSPRRPGDRALAIPNVSLGHLGHGLNKLSQMDKDSRLKSVPSAQSVVSLSENSCLFVLCRAVALA